MELSSDQVRTWVGILAYEDGQIEEDAQVTDTIVAPESILTLELKHAASGQAGGASGSPPPRSATTLCG